MALMTWHTVCKAVVWPGTLLRPTVRVDVRVVCVQMCMLIRALGRGALTGALGRQKRSPISATASLLAALQVCNGRETGTHRGAEREGARTDGSTAPANARSLLVPLLCCVESGQDAGAGQVTITRCCRAGSRRPSFSASDTAEVLGDAGDTVRFTCCLHCMLYDLSHTPSTLVDKAP